jgi:hypothetical protein
MPDLGHRHATAAEWVAVGALVSVFVLIAVIALVRS